MAGINMRGADSWETVTSKKSYSSTTGKMVEPLSKAKKKQMREKMPTIEPSAPIEESDTIYNAFLREEERRAKKEQEALQQTVSQEGSNSPSKKGVNATKKKAGVDKMEKKKEKPVTLDDAIKSIDVDELKNWLTKIQVAFPDNQDVWLKDLACLLNLRLDKVHEMDPIFTGKPSNYPCSLLTKPVKELLHSVVKDVPPKTLSVFLDFCLDSMLSDQSKSVPTFGYRLFIQLIIGTRPDIVLVSREKYLTLLHQNINRPVRALMILWSVGQVGHVNLASGLRVWLGIMLPVMNVRSLSNYCVLYLENLFRIHTNLKSGFDGLPKKDFFKLFDELYSLQSSLSTDLKKRLLFLYPKLKEVAWGPHSETTLHNLFSSFLSRCMPDCHATKKTELLSCLEQCLMTDSQSFSVWRQVYVKHLQQSSVLLQHISERLDGQLSINRKLLRETVQAFHLTNEEMSQDSTVAHTPHYKTCVTTCRDLLARLNASRFPWSKVILLVLLVLGAVFAYDWYSSGGLYKSRTYHTLDGLGIISFLKHCWQRIVFYLQTAYQWLTANVPYYFAKTSAILSPYLVLLWEKLQQAAVLIGSWCQPIVSQVQAQLPAVQHWLEEKLPVVLEFIAFYLTALLTVLVHVTFWLITTTWHYCCVVWGWLLMNVLIGRLSPDSILSTLSWILVSFQSYCYDVFIWCRALFV